VTGRHLLIALGIIAAAVAVSAGLLAAPGVPAWVSYAPLTTMSGPYGPLTPTGRLVPPASLYQSKLPPDRFAYCSDHATTWWGC
jgi:hypothetical protein